MNSEFDRAPDRLNATIDDGAHFQQSLAKFSRQRGRSGLGYVILWSLGIGMGVIAAGASWDSW